MDQDITSKLPSELISHIFTLGLPSNPAPASTHTPLLVSSVCQRWRNIAIYTPGLWTQIYHSPRLDETSVPRHPVRQAQIVCWLRRSQTQPLQINMRFGRLEELAFLTLALCAARRWKTVVLDFLESAAPRVRNGHEVARGSLLPWYFHQFDEESEDDDDAYSESSDLSSASNGSNVESEFDDDERAFVQVPFTGTVTPSSEYTTASTLQLVVPKLRSLQVYFSVSWPALDMQLARIANCAPALRELHWRGLHQYLTPFTHDVLRYLDILHDPLMNQSGKVWDVIRSARSLETLVLREYELVVGAKQVLTFSSLWRLCLKMDVESSFSPLIDLLTLPNLKVLELEVSEWSSERVIGLLDRSECSLEAFRLVDIRGPLSLNDLVDFPSMITVLGENALHEVEVLEVGYSQITDTTVEPLGSTGIDDNTVRFLRSGFSSTGTGTLDKTKQGTPSVPPCPKLRQLRLAQGFISDLDPKLFEEMLETRYKHGLKLEINLGLWLWEAQWPKPLDLTRLYKLHQEGVFTLTVEQVGDLTGVEWFREGKVVSMPVLKEEYALKHE